MPRTRRPALVGDVIVGVDGVVTVGGIVIGHIEAVKAVRNAGLTGTDRRYASGSALGKTGLLLPAADREEYVEEWRSWLWDMREAGQPWYRGVVEVLSIVLIATPRLAVTLRLSARRRVD